METVTKEELTTVLTNLDLNVEVVDMRPGPTLTLALVRPLSYFPVGNILRREEDIAFYLNVRSVRVHAVNEQGLVGIEIPNRERDTIVLSSLLDGPRLREPLAFPAGISATGQTVWYSLAKFPHLLIAGATGSGKSVFLHSLISTLVSTHQPEELRLVLVDPKRVEFTLYDDLPHHAFGSVCFSPNEAKEALQRVTQVMRTRYKMMAATGARNREEYKGEMPFYVVVIDELADLFGLDSSIEPLIIELVQLGRAAGIHLVMATQRPSVDIVSGRLKANCPARVAFKVSSAIDSRVILDQVGAEDLLGRGDAIFDVPGEDPTRVTACYISPAEIRRIVEYWAGHEPVVNEEAEATKPVEALYMRRSDLRNYTPETAAFLLEQGKQGKVKFV